VRNPLGDRRDWQTIASASGLGCSVVASLLLAIGGGVLLDRWAGIPPIFTIVGVVLGVATAGYLLYQLTMLSRPGPGERPPVKRRRTKPPVEPDEEDDE
jgi:F0F1-type ATP synthase assembly protein I